MHNGAGSNVATSARMASNGNHAMKSMTGYGAANGQAGKIGLSVEIRSVNQRHREIKISAPREYNAWETELRTLVAGSVARGRVEVSVGRTAGIRAEQIGVQHDLAAAYVKALKDLKRTYGLKGELDISLFQGRGEIFQSRGKGPDPEVEIKAVKRILKKALAAHSAERTREGANLERDISKRIAKLRTLVALLKKTTAGAAGDMRERLETRVRSLIGDTRVEDARLIQETALLAERADVTEELVRLDSHLDGLGQVVRLQEPAGKRFEFLLQEVAREFNTIASKSGNVKVTGLIVDAKSEVEKLREQIQNVE